MQSISTGLVCGIVLVLAAGYAAVQNNSVSEEHSFSGEHEHHEPLIPPISLGDVDTSADGRAHFHPHGEKVCASGCAASNHPTEALTIEQFNRLVEHFDTLQTDEASVRRRHAALETLLYFGPQTKQMLSQNLGAITASSRSVLQRHLETTHARLSIRVVDEQGVTRSWLPPTRVPFDRRHVFDMETFQLQPHVASGTVKRVGVDRVWTRL